MLFINVILIGKSLSFYPVTFVKIDFTFLSCVHAHERTALPQIILFFVLSFVGPKGNKSCVQQQIVIKLRRRVVGISYGSELTRPHFTNISPHVVYSQYKHVHLTL